MTQTRKQKQRESLAQMIDSYAGKNQTSAKLRADNRAVEKRKRPQDARAKP